MKQLGLSLSEYDLQAMMKSVGVGPQGKITFQGIILYVFVFAVAVTPIGSLYTKFRGLGGLRI